MRFVHFEGHGKFTTYAWQIHAKELPSLLSAYPTKDPYQEGKAKPKGLNLKLSAAINLRIGHALEAAKPTAEGSDVYVTVIGEAEAIQLLINVQKYRSSIFNNAANDLLQNGIYNTLNPIINGTIKQAPKGGKNRKGRN